MKQTRISCIGTRKSTQTPEQPVWGHGPTMPSRPGGNPTGRNPSSKKKRAERGSGPPQTQRAEINRRARSLRAVWELPESSPTPHRPEPRNTHLRITGRRHLRTQRQSVTHARSDGRGPWAGARRCVATGAKRAVPPPKMAAGGVLRLVRGCSFFSRRGLRWNVLPCLENLLKISSLLPYCSSQSLCRINVVGRYIYVVYMHSYINVV